MSKSLTFIAVAILALSVATSAQASDKARAQGYLNDAKQALDKGDARAAVIQLKNAVQADPDNGAARYELGVVEMRVGDYLSAEKELRAAIERKFDRDKVAAPLAETLLHLQKNQELLDEIPAGDRPAEIESGVRIARGYAFLALHRADDATKSFQDALARTAKPARAELGLARTLAFQGKLPEAVQETKKALDSDATFVDGWVFLGRLHRAQGDMKSARNDLDKALELNPDYLPARLERVSLLIASNELPLASADLDKVAKVAPTHPLGIYYRALLQAKQKDYRGAETSLQSLKGFLNSYPPAMYLLAAVNLAQGETAQAEENINRYLSSVPNNEAGTTLLASLLVRRGNLTRAIDVLRKALDAHPQSLRLMSALSDAYTRNKEPEKAAAILDRAAASRPEDAELRTKIAAQRLRLGRPDEAVADLETATELAPKSEEAGLLLVLTLLQTNKVDEALKAAEALQAHTPNEPLSENLLGAIMLRKGQVADAKAHFEKALQIKQDFTPAQMNLAQLAVLEKRDADADAIYETILKRDPTNLGALMAEADLSTRQGKAKDALLWLEKARNGNPKAVQPRLRLIAGYVQAKDPGKALAIADEVQKLAPENPAALSAIGEAHLANNQIPEALASFQHLVTVAPDNPDARLQLARAHYLAKDNEAVRADLEKAAGLAPGNPAVGQEFIRFALATKSVPKELDYLQRLAAKQAKDPAFDLLAGDLLMAAGKSSDATAEYAKGLAKREDSVPAIVKLSEATFRTNQAKGIDTLETWLKKHPDQNAARFALGGMLITAKRYDEAITQHEIVLKAQPNNAAAANNLAWLYQMKHDDRALPLAERAYKLAPNSADLADTLGWILVQKGQNDRGLELLGKAVKVQGAPPEVHYHLAVALKNAGRTEDARKNLEEALKANKPFEGMAAAQALLKELSRG